MASRAILAAIAIAVMAAPAWADFADGLRAFDGGDYRTAYREWSALAAEGDPESQVALAGLYGAGLGVPEDAAEAARWYRRAARQGHAVAQINLGEMYLTGRGVPRDRVRAYVWLSLAAAQGHAWAAEQKHTVAETMTAEQLAEAQDLLRTWRRGQR